MICLPVSFLTNTLVGGVTFVFVVQLVVGHIDGVAVLAVGHRTVRLVAGAIHRLCQDIIDISSVTMWTLYFHSYTVFSQSILRIV